MRTVVQEKRKIRAGDIARISVKLKGGRKRARIFIFSRYNGVGDFAPHTDDSMSDMLKDGKPLMLSPSRVILSHDRKTKVTLQFRALEPMEFQVIEELDFGETVNVKARITTDGKTIQACRRIFGSIGRKIRNRAASSHGN